MNKNLLKTTFTALFAAIICIGSFMKIPVGVIPIVLQNMLCILSAVVLGGIYGATPTLLFVIAGAIGLPVFSGGSGGLATLFGPTGGFIIGYLLGAVAAGLIAGKPSVSEKKLSKKTVIRVSAAFVAGAIIIYIPGIIRFAMWAAGAGKVPQDKTAFAYTMGAAVLPFLPGDVIKMLIMIPLSLKLRPVVAQYISSQDKNAD